MLRACAGMHVVIKYLNSIQTVNMPKGRQIPFISSQTMTCWTNNHVIIDSYGM
jgi:hypothetical protein